MCGSRIPPTSHKYDDATRRGMPLLRQTLMIKISQTLLDRFWPKVEKLANESGCWLWLASTLKTGYGKFHIPGVRGWTSAHRVSYLIHYGELPSDKMVLHKCDTPGCVRPDHLYLGDHISNMRDMVGRDRSLKGKRYNTKLSNSIVRQIRKEYAEGKSSSQIAQHIGVSRRHVSSVTSRQRWEYLPELLDERVDRFKDRSPKGEAHPRSKLKTEDVCSIRKMHSEGANFVELSKFFGVSPVQIRKVVNRKAWAHIQ